MSGGSEGEFLHLALTYNRVMSWSQIPPQHVKKLVNRVLLDTATIFPVIISIAITDSLLITVWPHITNR